MTRFVVDAGVLIHLAEHGIEPAAGRELLAPTLIRSEVLSRLHEAVHSGELADDVARARLEAIWRIRVRLLGDAVLRRRAWELATRFGWASGPLGQTRGWSGDTRTVCCRPSPRRPRAYGQPRRCRRVALARPRAAGRGGTGFELVTRSWRRSSQGHRPRVVTSWARVLPRRLSSSAMTSRTREDVAASGTRTSMESTSSRSVVTTSR